MISALRLGIAPARPVLLACLLAGIGGASRAAPVSMQEDFGRPWSGQISPDDMFRVNGPWIGSGGNVLDPSLAASAPLPGAAAAALSLSVAPARPGQTPYHGSEIQSRATFGQGYYEATMQVTDVPGVCASFFWIEAPQYGPHEIDVEFLTDEPWIADPHHGAVHLTLHPSEATFRLDLPFNPSRALHRYGFLWHGGQVAFTVDGVTAHVFADPRMAGAPPGFVMANTYTGRKYWGGGPPARRATTFYTRISFRPGLTSVSE